MNKTAIVTGANSGIGLATAKRLAADGWRVFAFDHVLSNLEAPAGPPPGLVPVLCDVTSEASVAEAFATVAATGSRLDALVCSAGVLRTGTLAEMSVADFDLLFAVNTRGPWLCTRAALPLLERRDPQDVPGSIIMIASIAATRPKVNGGAYAASKAALTQLTRVLGAELGPRGLRVNAIGPGTVDTPMIQAAMTAKEGYRASGASPIGRIAQPSDIAAAVAMLLSPEAEFITGAFIPVDGGTSAAFTS